jgi:hypothetical protein
MSGVRAERFVIFGLRLLGVTFAVVGLLFLALPTTVADTLTDVGSWFGDFADPPGTGMRLWLTLGFSYMVVIAGLCAVAQADPVRYRPLIALLAVGKLASSLTALGFFIFTDDVFIYLLNFLVDGSLVLVALWLWILSGRIGRQPGPG